MYCNNYSIESVLPTPIPLGNAFLLVVSLVFFGAIFVVIASNVCYSLVNHKCQKFLMFFFTMVSKLNVKEHIIPHIPCGKVGKDNYRLLDVSQLK